MSLSPLLAPNANPAKSATSSTHPSPFAKGLLTFVGLSRVAFGASCLAAPPLALYFFGLRNLSPEASLITRMFGGREIVIGTLLLLAERSAAGRRGISLQTTGNAEVRRAIWGNVVTDSLDVVALVAMFTGGVLESGAFVKIGATALVLVVAGVETAWMYP